MQFANTQFFYSPTLEMFTPIAGDCSCVPANRLCHSRIRGEVAVTSGVTGKPDMHVRRYLPNPLSSLTTGLKNPDGGVGTPPVAARFGGAFFPALLQLGQNP